MCCFSFLVATVCLLYLRGRFLSHFANSDVSFCAHSFDLNSCGESSRNLIDIERLGPEKTIFTSIVEHPRLYEFSQFTCGTSRALCSFFQCASGPVGNI